MSFAVREARVTDAEAIARVEVATWRDAYPLLLPRRYLVGAFDIEARTGAWRQRITRRADRKLVVAALEAPQPLIGYATFGRSRLSSLPFAGELYEIYLIADYQGQGLGRRLCAAVAEHLMKSGAASMCVEVLERNPSRYFYEALGGRLAACNRHPFADSLLPTVVYAWDDLTLLARERA